MKEKAVLWVLYCFSRAVCRVPRRSNRGGLFFLLGSPAFSEKGSVYFILGGLEIAHTLVNSTCLALAHGDQIKIPL
jgi:hypothetical protein